MSTLATLTCAECGRMTVKPSGPHPYPLCAACISAPGWFSDPLLSALLAPPASTRADEPKRRSAPRPQRKPASPIAVLASIIWVGVIAATLLAFF